MKLPPFEYACPATLNEAVALLAGHDGEAKPLAGGQSLMPMMAFRIAQPSLLVDLRKLPGLDEIKIGAGRRAARRAGALARHPRRQAARQPRIRCCRRRSRTSRITRSATAAPSAAASRMPIRPPRCPASRVTCDAEIAVIGKAGARTIKAADFFKGALTTALEPDEIITEVHLPAWPAARRWGFQEFARRRGDFAMAGVALYYDRATAARPRTPTSACSASATASAACRRPRRRSTARRSTRRSPCKVGEAAAAEVEPQEDIHASAAYRRALAGTLAERALKAAAAR